MAATPGHRLTISLPITKPGYIGSENGYGCEDTPTLRVVTEDLGPSNVLLVKGRIKDQNSWDTIATINGSDSVSIDISSYSFFSFECTTYSFSGSSPKLLAENFFKKPIGGSSITADTFSTVSVPNGTNPAASGNDTLTFTSSDASVVITGDSGTNTINLQTIASAPALDDVTDVDAPTPSDGEILKYNSGSGNWENSSDLQSIESSNPAIILTNNSGATILAYTPVRIDTNGDIDTIDVSVESEARSAIGVVDTNVVNTAQGEVRADRVIKNVSLGFSFGSILYINKTGTLTDTAPSIGVNGFLAGDMVVRVGIIAKNQDNPVNKDLILDIDIVGKL